MKRILYTMLAVIMLMTLGNNASSQSIDGVLNNTSIDTLQYDSTPDEDKIFDSVEENAQFPDGDDACMKFLSAHIKYPTMCQEQGIQGRVLVSFVVNYDGTITDIKAVRSPDSNLTKEAIRVVKCMPKWIPAKIKGKPVRCRFTLPMIFRLSNPVIKK